MGFSDITTTGSSYLMSWPGVETVSDSKDAAAIAEAYATYVKVSQELLNILIGKSGVSPDLSMISPPVRSVLIQYEAVVDVRCHFQRNITLSIVLTEDAESDFPDP